MPASDVNKTTITTKKALQALILLFILMSVIAGRPSGASGADNTSALRQKMADISLLQSQLNERKREAIDIREALYRHLSVLRSEIEGLVDQEKITAFKTAQYYPRIRYNLQLSGEVLAYIDQFNQKISFYQIGQDKLDYLYQQADDDLKIINTLTHLKIEALLAQIDVVIFEYLPEAHRILISLNELEIDGADTIWKKIMGK